VNIQYRWVPKSKPIVFHNSINVKGIMIVVMKKRSGKSRYFIWFNIFHPQFLKKL
jgi:hypothetical protein